MEHGINGMLVDFFDSEALAKQVAFLLDHLAERQQLGQNARQTIVEHYNLATLLPQTIEWFSRSVSSSDGSYPTSYEEGDRLRGDRHDSWELF